MKLLLLNCEKAAGLFLEEVGRKQGVGTSSRSKTKRNGKKERNGEKSWRF